MKNNVTPQTAFRLKAAGFPQPQPEFGQIWATNKMFLFSVDSYWGSSAVQAYFQDGSGRRVIQIHTSAYCPDATDILREIDLFSITHIPETNVWHVFYVHDGVLKCFVDKNPAEAAALAWLAQNENKESEQERPESNAAASNSGTAGNTYTAGEELTAGDLVYVANSGLIMKSEPGKPFPAFWYESNATWGSVASLDELAEQARRQLIENNGMYSLDHFLDNSRSVGDGRPNFGTRREHTGEQTLRMYLVEHGLLDEFLETWNK